MTTREFFYVKLLRGKSIEKNKIKHKKINEKKERKKKKTIEKLIKNK